MSAALPGRQLKRAFVPALEDSDEPDLKRPARSGRLSEVMSAAKPTATSAAAAGGANAARSPFGAANGRPAPSLHSLAPVQAVPSHARREAPQAAHDKATLLPVAVDAPPPPPAAAAAQQPDLIRRRPAFHAVVCAAL